MRRVLLIPGSCIFGYGWMKLYFEKDVSLVIIGTVLYVVGFVIMKYIEKYNKRPIL